MSKPLAVLLLFLGACTSAAPKPSLPVSELATAPALEAPEVPTPQPVPQSQYRGIPNEPGIFNLYFGARFMDDKSFWKPLEDQFTLGVDYTFKNRDSAVGLTFGAVGAGSREKVGGRDIDTWTAELYIGPRAYLAIPGAPIYFYAGVCGSLIYGQAEVLTITTTDRTGEVSFGASGQLAAMLQLNSKQAIGVEYRTLRFTDVSFFGVDSDFDYDQVTFVFSAAF